MVDKLKKISSCGYVPSQVNTYTLSCGGHTTSNDCGTAIEIDKAAIAYRPCGWTAVDATTGTCSSAGGVSCEVSYTDHSFTQYCLTTWGTLKQKYDSIFNYGSGSVMKIGSSDASPIICPTATDGRCVADATYDFRDNMLTFCRTKSLSTVTTVTTCAPTGSSVYVPVCASPPTQLLRVAYDLTTSANEGLPVCGITAATGSTMYNTEAACNGQYAYGSTGLMYGCNWRTDLRCEATLLEDIIDKVQCFAQETEADFWSILSAR